MTGDGRIGLGAAVAFAVLYLLQRARRGRAARARRPAAEIQRYFVNHADAIATSAWLVVVATRAAPGVPVRPAPAPGRGRGLARRPRLRRRAGARRRGRGRADDLARTGLPSRLQPARDRPDPRRRPALLRARWPPARCSRSPWPSRWPRCATTRCPRGSARPAWSTPPTRCSRAHRLRRRHRRLRARRVGEPRRDARLPAVGRRRRGGTCASLSSRGCPRRPQTS